MAKARIVLLQLIIPLVAFATVVASPLYSQKTSGASRPGITIEPLKMHSSLDVTKLPGQEIADLF